MSKIITCSVLSIIFFMSGCANREYAFSEVKPSIDNQAVIYIYRPHSVSNIMLSPKVLIDGNETIEIKNNQHVFFHLKPKSHVIKLDVVKRYTGNHELVVKLDALNIVYLRVSSSMKFEMGKPYSRSFNLEQVERSLAMSEIVKTKYSKNQNKDKEKGGITRPSKFSTLKTRNPFSK